MIALIGFCRFDECGVVESKRLHNEVNVGDKVEIIPNHVCSAVNLYDNAYLVCEGKVVDKIAISCRGKVK